MTKPKFTPGPWHVEIRNRYYGPQKHTEVHAANGALIADVSPWKAHKANARLIAVAPKMLAFLEKLVNQIEENGLMQYDVIHNGENWVLEEAKKILRESIGESEVSE